MSAEASSPSAKSAPPASAHPPRYIPGWGVRIALALCLIGVAIVRTLPSIEGMPSPWNDLALANLLTLILSFIAGMTLLVWFALFSSHPGLLRWMAVAGVLLAIGAFFALFRFVGVSGDMFLTFEPRWVAPADRAIGALAPIAADADLATTTDDDFPQFLGPERRNWVPGPELARDWQATPPQELWRRAIGAGWSAFSVVNGNAVTMEQRGDEEWVACYRVDDGEPVWGHAITTRHENPLGGIGPRSTPTIHAGRVYALGATGVLRCLDGNTGKLLWQDDLRARYGLDAVTDEVLVQWGRAASPLIVDDLVVVPAGGPRESAKSLIAFKAETGEVAWEGGFDQISYASPVLATLAGVRQILIVNEKTASGHDPKTGELLWSHDWPGNEAVPAAAAGEDPRTRLALLPGNSSQDATSSQPVPLPGDRLLLTKGYGGGAALLQFAEGDGGAVKIAESLWRNPKALETKFTNVSVIGEHIYGLSNGYLECIELATGVKTWKKNRQQNYGHGQILGVGNLLLVQAEDGRVALVDSNPEKFVELATLAVLSDKTWNSLCLAGNKLLVRNSREAVCLELPTVGDKVERGP
jgi:outer membrane protein assembly factor BamB